jgi:hypothetical protein
MKSKLAATFLPIILIVLIMLLSSDPLLANKFETIGGGVQGSDKLKIEFLEIIAYVIGGIFLIAGILAIALHNNNAQTLNYTMWKSSAALFFILGTGSLAAGYFMS